MCRTPLGLLTISEVEKHFDGNVVLDGIDLDIEEGRIYQLIGPNGCGKTTLINVISGLFGPSAGRVVFDGTDITGMGLYETYGIGLVRTWQIPQPFINLNTAENFLVSGSGNAGESFLYAPVKPRWRTDEEKIAGTARDMMGMVNLSEKTEVTSQNLSGGQQKLLEMGRAMMSDVKMILMDEPIAGVNPTLAHDIFKRISRICREQNITFLIVEHRLDIAFQYVDHVFALDDGHIIAEGTAEEIIKNPKVIESYIGN